MRKHQCEASSPVTRRRSDMAAVGLNSVWYFFMKPLEVCPTSGGSVQSRVQSAQEQQVAGQSERLVRMHSPVIGSREAPVTIVEFFDPVCETCRAFYPVVK